MAEQSAVAAPISSDLTFLTNEPGLCLRDRFGVLLDKDTRYFDCLVGYFFISGFYKLYPALENVEKIRILVGLKTDQAACIQMWRHWSERSTVSFSRYTT